MTTFEDRLPAAAEAARGVLAGFDGAQAMWATFTLHSPNSYGTGPVRLEWADRQWDWADEPFDFDEISAVTRAVEPLATALLGAKTTIVTAVVRAGGPVRFEWVVSPGMSHASPVGALKVGRRRRRTAPPPVVALTDATAVNDPAELRSLLAARGHTRGFTEDQIAKAEARRRVAFPPELRLFFSLVKQGVVLAGADPDDEGLGPYAEVRDGLLAGTGKIGNVVDPAKRWLTPNTPLPTMPARTPDDVVQPVYAAPGWIVFADDGGGNAYALDLVPGPQGRVGQVVQFDHERDDPPELVAWSLTDFLAGRWASAPRPARRKAAGDLPSDVTLSTYYKKYTLSPGEVPALKRLTIGVTKRPVSLDVLVGASGLAVLELARPAEDLGDLSPLRTLTGLEHLAAPPDVWAAIVEQEAWPPALVTAEFDRARYESVADLIALANVVLVHYGNEPLPTHVWEG